jgi:hypothetical protein
MQPFHILYFRQSVLRRAETIEGDLLEVIDQATDHRSDDTAEIWSEFGKVGIVEAVPRQTVVEGSQQTDGPVEAEISAEMKQRLDFARETAKPTRR